MSAQQAFKAVLPVNPLVQLARDLLAAEARARDLEGQARAAWKEFEDLGRGQACLGLPSGGALLVLDDGRTVTLTEYGGGARDWRRSAAECPVKIVYERP